MHAEQWIRRMGKMKAISSLDDGEGWLCGQRADVKKASCLV